MTWQHIVILTLIILNCGANVFRTARNPRLTGGQAAFAALIAIGYYVAFAAILHSGGFW